MKHHPNMMTGLNNRDGPSSTGAKLNDDDCFDTGAAVSTPSARGHVSSMRKKGLVLLLLAGLAIVAAIARFAPVGVMSYIDYARRLDSEDDTVRSGRSCSTDSDCRGSRRFCKYQDGICEGEGVCVRAPNACTDTYDPVCGCDGDVYSNQCSAFAARVSIFANNENCERMQCGDDDDCAGDDEFCEFEPGDCGDLPGECASMAVVCTGGPYRPVCGCDGTTYFSICVAYTEGASIVSDGECCASNDDCESGVCMSNGVCDPAEPDNDGGPI